MANDQKSDAVKVAREHLAKLARDSRAQMLGLSKPLTALDAALAEQAHQQRTIANALLILEQYVRHGAPDRIAPFTERTRAALVDIFEAGDFNG